jgi:hypothetical protein
VNAESTPPDRRRSNRQAKEASYVSQTVPIREALRVQFLEPTTLPQGFIEDVVIVLELRAVLW